MQAPSAYFRCLGPFVWSRILTEFTGVETLHKPFFWQKISLYLEIAINWAIGINNQIDDFHSNDGIVEKNANDDIRRLEQKIDNNT